MLKSFFVQKNKKYRRVVFAVVYRRKNGKIEYLLLKRKLHWKGWEFPKGGIERFESKKMTVWREVFEETGIRPIRIKNHRFDGSYNYKKNIPKRPFVGQIFYLYSAEINSDSEVKIDGREHSDFQWIDFRKSLHILTWDNQRECLKRVDDWVRRKVD